MTASCRMFRLAGMACLAIAISYLPAAEPIVFPADGGVVDVTKSPYNAKADGISDATEAIQKALDDHPNGRRIIYLPKGTYLISNTLSWPSGSSGGIAQKRTTLYGAGVEHTTLLLKAGAAGFQNPAQTKSMIWTGKAPAQRFGNEIFDLTVNTNGNPGATGIQFKSNNQGAVRNVVITAGPTGKGVVGLDMGHSDEIGPLLVKNVKVLGFDRGIRAYWQVNSITLEDIEVRNQNVYGIDVYHQAIFVRRFKSVNSVPAIYNRLDANGYITLIDAELIGEGAASTKPAIHNQKQGFYRNVKSQGYAKAIDNDDKGRDCGDKPDGMVEEMHSHCSYKSLFDSPKKTLNLPVKEIPELPMDPLAQWTSPMAYGAVGDGKVDDTKAVQAALNSGKTTVYFPGGKSFLLSGTLTISGPVRRIIGLRNRLSGTATFRFVDAGANDAPVVLFEGLHGLYHNITMEHASKRTLVMSHIEGIRPHGNGSGDLFLNDIVTGGVELLNKNQHVWARQLNLENQDKAKLVNMGATFWVLGLKTERGNIVIDTKEGGRTEVLGAFIYSTSVAKVDPMFSLHNASGSFVGIVERNFNNNPYQVWYRETRGTQTRELARPGGSVFTGYVAGTTASRSETSTRKVARELPALWTDYRVDGRWLPVGQGL